MTRHQDRTSDDTSRGSKIQSGSLHGVTLSAGYHVETKMRPDRDFKTDGDCAVAALRARLIGRA